MKQLEDPRDYTLRRYREARTDGERKAWMDFFKHNEPDLYQQLKGEQAK